jgi:hypothetical protein
MEASVAISGLERRKVVGAPLSSGPPALRCPDAPWPAGPNAGRWTTHCGPNTVPRVNRDGLHGLQPFNSYSAKSTVMPTSPSDIRNVVTKEDDFGHEMRVGHVIRSCPAIQVQHGGTYTDSVTQKPRQFDYRCSLRQERAKLSLAVECKNLSPSVPLVVCGTTRREDEAFHDLIESRNGTFKRGSATLVGLSSVTRRARREDAFYPPNSFVGKSLVRIQTDRNPMVRTQDSDVYDKWAQALSSAVELAESACNSAENLSHTAFFTAVLPAVVVPDDLLWRLVYDENGSVSADPAQVNECELFVGRKIEVGGAEGTPLFHVFTFSHVHFFTLSGFGSFLSRMALNQHAWAKLFTHDALEI